MSDSFERDREIIRQATPGPWVWSRQKMNGGLRLIHVMAEQGSCEPVLKESDSHDQPNRKLVEQARTRWPAALDRITEQEAEIERLRGVLGEIRALLDPPAMLQHVKLRIDAILAREGA